MTTSDKPAPVFFAYLCDACRAAAERVRASGERRSSVCHDCAAAILENARVVKTEVSRDESAEITSRELSFVRVDKPAPDHPPPWRWVQQMAPDKRDDFILFDARSEILLLDLTSFWNRYWQDLLAYTGEGPARPKPPSSAAVRELVRAAPEMEALLDDILDRQARIHCGDEWYREWIATAEALLARLDEARRG